MQIHAVGLGWGPWTCISVAPGWYWCHGPRLDTSYTLAFRTSLGGATLVSSVSILRLKTTFNRRFVSLPHLGSSEHAASYCFEWAGELTMWRQRAIHEPGPEEPQRSHIIGPLNAFFWELGKALAAEESPLGVRDAPGERDLRLVPKDACFPLGLSKHCTSFTDHVQGI